MKLLRMLQGTKSSNVEAASVTIMVLEKFARGLSKELCQIWPSNGTSRLRKWLILPMYSVSITPSSDLSKNVKIYSRMIEKNETL